MKCLKKVLFSLACIFVMGLGVSTTVNADIVINNDAWYISKVNDFLSDGKWSNGVSWNGDHGPFVSSKGAGCAAYANDFTTYMFGHNGSFGSGESFLSASEIRPGDAVEIYDPYLISINATYQKHIFVVLDRKGNALKTAEGNYLNKVNVSSTRYSVSGGNLYQDGTAVTIADGHHHFASTGGGSGTTGGTVTAGTGSTGTTESSNPNNSGFWITNGVLTSYSGSDTNVVIPSNVTSIGDFAFNENKNIQSIEIPNTVTSIGECAFWYLENLQSIVIPNSVKNIGEAAFQHCTRLNSITIPNGITHIGEYTFADCHGITNITIPNSVVSIEQGAFENCINLKSISISASVKKLGMYAFAGCPNLTNITIPNGVSTIEKGVFIDCTGLKSVTIPGSVQTLNEAVFSGCENLKTVFFNEGVTYIGTNSFHGCPVLESVSIPKSLKEFGERPFSGRSKFFNDIYYGGTREQWNAIRGVDQIYNGANPTVHFVDGSTYTPKGAVINNSVKLKSIKLNMTKATMSLNQQIQLGLASYTPVNATNLIMSWSTSNPAVAIVDANGLVTCVGPGNAKITGMTTDGSKKKVTCTITGPKQASSVKITGPKTIEYQSTAQLYAAVKPDNAVNKGVTWSIDKGNGTVDANGVVTCTGSGDIKVRATTSNGKKSTYTLKGPKAASSVKITGPKTIEYHGTAQLSATIKPDNAIDKTVTWSIEKGNGEVDANGLVTCTGSGDIKVRATSSNGKKATYTLKGPKAASSVKITGPKTIDYQGTAQLTATVKPDNAIDKTVTWSIDKGNGKVDPVTGLVTCTGAGDIKVRATSANGKKATYTLKGPKDAASVKITGEKNIILHGTVQLTATVKPDNAIDKSVTWMVEKGNGTVDANGLVTCTGAGDIKIRATSTNGKKGTFTIKGPKAASSVSVTKSSYKLAVGESVQPVATVKPANAIDLTVTWSSSDPAIATVSPEGVITAVAPGKTTILATAHNGKVGKCTVTVQ